MMEPEEITDTEAEMLPPGEYPFWTPYGSYQTAATLMQAFNDDETMC